MDGTKRRMKGVVGRSGIDGFFHVFRIMDVFDFRRKRFLAPKNDNLLLYRVYSR